MKKWSLLSSDEKLERLRIYDTWDSINILVLSIAVVLIVLGY